jgi:hypothetical protein
MGVVNPYSEEVLQQNKKTASQSATSDYTAKLRGASRLTASNTGDAPSYVTIPFNKWWIWCQRCKHGGHCGHLEEWFLNHDECPVSDCNCTCLNRDKDDLCVEAKVLSPVSKSVSAPITPQLKSATGPAQIFI